MGQILSRKKTQPHLAVKESADSVASMSSSSSSVNDLDIPAFGHNSLLVDKVNAILTARHNMWYGTNGLVSNLCSTVVNDVIIHDKYVKVCALICVDTEDDITPDQRRFGEFQKNNMMVAGILTEKQCLGEDLMMKYTVMFSPNKTSDYEKFIEDSDESGETRASVTRPVHTMRAETLSEILFGDDYNEKHGPPLMSIDATSTQKRMFNVENKYNRKLIDRIDDGASSKQLADWDVQPEKLFVAFTRTWFNVVHCLRMPSGTSRRAPVVSNSVYPANFVVSEDDDGKVNVQFLDFSHITTSKIRNHEALMEKYSQTWKDLMHDRTIKKQLEKWGLDIARLDADFTDNNKKIAADEQALTILSKYSFTKKHRKDAAQKPKRLTEKFDADVFPAGLLLVKIASGFAEFQDSTNVIKRDFFRCAMEFAKDLVMSVKSEAETEKFWSNVRKSLQELQDRLEKINKSAKDVGSTKIFDTVKAVSAAATKSTTKTTKPTSVSLSAFSVPPLSSSSSVTSRSNASFASSAYSKIKMISHESKPYSETMQSTQSTTKTNTTKAPPLGSIVHKSNTSKKTPPSVASKVDAKTSKTSKTSKTTTKPASSSTRASAATSTRSKVSVSFTSSTPATISHSTTTTKAATTKVATKTKAG